MKEAYLLRSWRGIMKEQIMANKIKSPAHARKLAPFVDKDKFPFIWVNWSKPKVKSGKKTQPYFRRYPTSRKKSNKSLINLDDELKNKNKISESELHKKARTELKRYIDTLIKDGKAIKWNYKDFEISNFTISGNLLSEVEEVQTHYRFKTPYDIEYEFDIALLGKKLAHERILLGVIEIEHTHNFGYLKLIISKCLGIPMVSINVSDLTPELINEKWCKNAISETTQNSKDGLRRNYIYLHNSLYPIFTNIPKNIRIDNKHQYVIFCKDEKFYKLKDVLKKYKQLLKLSDKDVLIQKVGINIKNETSLKTAKNEGSIAGPDWDDFSQKAYIRLTLKVPFDKKDNLYLYHFVIARLLNTYYETLVGYKYELGINNENPENHLWTTKINNKKIILKNLSEPVGFLIEHLVENGIIDRLIKIDQ